MPRLHTLLPQFLVQQILALALLIGIGAGPARAADHVNFGLDGPAQAAYGGFYQALATGLYATYGLDVAIRPAGPQTDPTALLLSGQIDLGLAANSFLALDFAARNLPFRAVAAFFQQDPAMVARNEAGFRPYASLLTAPDTLLSAHPDMIQRFIRASAEGWADFLNGDPAPAYRLIKHDNPDMTDAMLVHGRDLLRLHNIVQAADGTPIGAMSEARWQDFFRDAAGAGRYPPGLDWHHSLSLRFVDRGLATRQLP